MMDKWIRFFDKVFNDTLGNWFDDTHAIVLIYILYNYDIYFSEIAKDDGYVNVDDVGLAFEATLRVAAGIIEGIYSLRNIEGKNYVLLLGQIDNPYEVPDKLKEKEIDVRKRLEAHPYIQVLKPAL